MRLKECLYRLWCSNTFSLDPDKVEMVVPLLAEGLERGLAGLPYLTTVIKTVFAVGVVYLLKIYFGGAKCKSERDMHGKVILITVRPNRTMCSTTH